MGKPSKPAAPRHLSDASRRVWRSTVAAYELADHHLILLTLALEATDAAERARATLERDGEYTVTRTTGVVRAHPAAAVGNLASIRAARLWRELNLDEDTDADARPPRIGRSY